MGPVLRRRQALHAGDRFGIKGWAWSAAGECLSKQVFRGPAERRGIDPKQWKITEPKAGTRDPLIVDFDRPLDYALLQDVFQVKGVAGKMSVGPGETQWRFQPEQPWKSGNHTLVIDMALEDLAGNRIGRPFDVDTVDKPTERITKSSMRLTFKVP